jgi:DNA-binding GntR family transcriptional regulator
MADISLREQTRQTTAEAGGETLTDRAYTRLEEMIVTLRFAPGEILSEVAIAEQLKIGRTPIREALQRLARESLVVILPRRGILVSDINPRKQLLLLQVRREIERLLARTGALRSTEAEKEEFFEIAEGMERAARDNDDIDFMRLDQRLHNLTKIAARNEYASSAIGLLQGLSRRFWYSHYRQAGDMPQCARLHADQARAMAQGDPEAAAQASDKLMNFVESFTRATVDADFRPTATASEQARTTPKSL